MRRGFLLAAVSDFLSLFPGVPANRTPRRSRFLVKKNTTKAGPRTFDTPSSKHPLVIGIIILVCSAIFLFARLGHYALWDDEAGTALNAVAVWKTGDTTAVIDHNIVAYQNGKDLKNLKERYMPPLPAYLSAPFVGLLGREAWAARLPFAICGLLCVGMICWWLRSMNVDSLTQVIAGIALLCNVSFFLYFRQCRYYGLAIFTTTALALLYLNWKEERGKLICFVLLSICLFASNYLNYVAFYACLALDVLLWRRKEIRLRLADWLILVVPQLVMCSLVFWIWNPLANPPVPIPASEQISRPMLFWWYWRDSILEFANPMVIALALPLCFLRANRSLLRALLFLLLYIAVMTMAAPHPPAGNPHIEVRYLAPCITVFIAVTVLVVIALTRRAPWMAVPLAIVGCSFNWHPIAFGPVQLMPTVASYIKELIEPPGDPYTAGANWIKRNVREKQSIWVWPGWGAYPLMFHQPGPLYAWQLTYPPKEEQFKKLDLIHFQRQTPPDYIMVFGPEIERIWEDFHENPRRGVKYDFAEALDVYWQDLHRPEFLRRTFTPITDYDKNTEGIYILKRTDPPMEEP